jgi:hypothetical protein
MAAMSFVTWPILAAAILAEITPAPSSNGVSTGVARTDGDGSGGFPPH